MSEKIESLVKMSGDQSRRHTEITSGKYTLHRMIGRMSGRSDPRLETGGAQVIVEANQTLIAFASEVALKARITAHSCPQSDIQLIAHHCNDSIERNNKINRFDI